MLPSSIKQNFTERIIQPVFLLFFLFAGVTPPALGETPATPTHRTEFLPVYDDIAIGVAERDDGNEKNRDIGYNVRYAGGEIRRSFSESVRGGISLTARQRIERYDDTRDGRIYDPYVNFGPSFLYFDSPWIGLRAGRLRFNLMDGFIFSGEANGIHFRFTPPFLGRGFEIGGDDFNADREEHLRGIKSGSERISSLYAKYDAGSLLLNLAGLYYRDPGWIEEMTDPDPTSGELKSYRIVSSPDTGVHYYALRMVYTGGSFNMRMIASGVSGHRLFPDLISRPVPVKIAGRMGFAALGYSFGADQKDAGCREGMSELCPFDSVKNGPLVEVAGLASSRDRGDDDGKLSGYDAIRPGIREMGGMFSQLITADTGFPTPFRNIGPDRIYFRLPEQSAIPSNSDPSYPPYLAGMEALSLRFSFVLYALRFDLFANHGNFERGKAIEGIARVHYAMSPLGMNLSLFGGISNMRLYYNDGCEKICPGIVETESVKKRVIFGASFRI